MASYRDQMVWRKAMDLAEGAYSLVHLMPKEEQFRLTAQLLRAAVSVPANIAEGRARTGKREFLNFLSIASGSLAETETLLMLAVRTGPLPREQVVPVFKLAEEVGRMLTTLKQNLRARVGVKP